jgi:POT family proton-dependent oligopeptide transporter
MKDMALWDEADWIAAIAVVVLGAFLTAGAAIAVSRKPEVMGHPKGLYMLFFAEMWERFSYYGMRAILVFYLTQHWLFNDGRSNLIYGAYTSLVYITPVLGGYLADRYLGQRKAVVFGGVLLALGHGFMAVEGVGGQDDPTINVFWFALALIIVGSGFLKANISVMVGQLYRLTDLRRDAAYTIFYMGINAGAALGTILVGYLGQTVGWGFGFGLAGNRHGRRPDRLRLGKKVLLGAGEAPAPLSRAKEFTLYGIGLAAVALMWGLGPVPGRDPEPADRLGRRAAALRGLRELQAAQGTARADVRDPVPDCAQPAVLGPCSNRPGAASTSTPTGSSRSAACPPRCSSRSTRSTSSCSRRLRGVVDPARQARLRTLGAGQFALALAQVGLGFLLFVWGAELGRPGVATPVGVRVPDLCAAYDGRAVPLARRPVGDEPPGADIPRLADHGRVVLYDRGGQFRRRQDRRGHRRRKRRE